MIVIRDGVAAGELLEIRHITLEHVVERHRGGALARALLVEAGSLRLAVAAGADRHLDPGEQIVEATARISYASIHRAAIGLLPGLIEAKCTGLAA